MENTAKVYRGVVLGAGAKLGGGVEIGVPPDGVEEGDLPTVIGADALIRSHAVIYAGNTIGSGFRTGHHVLVREHNRFGDRVSVGTGVVVEHHVVIGDDVRLHSQVFVPEYSVLEDGCWLGPRVVLTNDRYPVSVRSKDSLVGPRIGRGARVGANATILPGVSIGEGALVGAGSVVTRDVPPRKVAVGNPARIIGDVADLAYPDGSAAYPEGRRRPGPAA